MMEEGESGVVEASGGSESDDGFPWLWSCVGCGCASMLMVVCAGGLGVVFAQKMLFDFAKGVERSVEIRKEVRAEREKLVEKQALRAHFETPMTERSFGEMHATVQSWKQSDAFQQIEALAEIEEKASGDGAFGEKVRALYLLWKSASAFQSLGARYLDAIEKHGGIEAHYGRLLRVGALVAAVHEVSTDHRFDSPGEPTSDAIAQLLAERHDEVVAKYGEKIERLRSGDPTFEELAKQGGLGVYALAVLPAESYQTWHRLSVERRENVIEDFGWTLTAEALTFGNLAFPVELSHELPVNR